MKIALVFLLLFSAYAFAQEDWIFLNRAEKVNRFSLTAKGKLVYDGQEFKDFILQQSANRIGVSPVSPDGKNVMVLSFGDQDSQCAVLRLQNKIAKSIMLQGTPMVWNSWSPDGAYLVLSTYTETDHFLYSISLNSFQAQKIPVQLQQAGEKTDFVTTAIEWTAPNIFQMEAEIHCAPGSAGCTEQKEEKVLRLYKLTVNAATLQVTPEEQPLAREEM